jgi:hypothetical protein
LSKREVAVKLEPLNTDYSQLENEVDVYKSLAGGTGIASVHWFGVECSYQALVLDRLGLSLQDLFQRSNSKFTLKTVLLLADQMVQVKSTHMI